MILIDYLLLIGAIFLLIPTCVLLFQVVSAVFLNEIRRCETVKYAEKRPAVAVIVPAHNEEMGIVNTLISLIPQLTIDDRLIVVADNCTDDTANVAKQYGAQVLVRNNLSLRGKGYALDHAIQFLKDSPPEVVIIVDADCKASPYLIDVLSRKCAQMQRPIQADYLMTFLEADSLKKRLTEFAWMVKNKIRPTGYKNFGLPCQLMGTGMAFLWSQLIEFNLATGHLVEDMKLGVEMATAGYLPNYCSDADVTSLFPTSEDGLANQRARWEHGHLSVITKDAPRLIWGAVKKKNVHLIMMALDLIVPPLALLMMLAIISFGITSMWAIFVGSILPFVISACVLVMLSVSIFLAWYGYAKHIISFNQLLKAPWILIAKLPLYVKFLVNRQSEWVRSKRDS